MSVRNSIKNDVIKLTVDLIRINTVNPPGNELEAAEFLASWMEKNGFDEVEIQKIDKNRGNIIGVIKGSGEKPSLIFNGHLDVAPPGDLRHWKYDPFEGVIADGKIYGRGAADMKSGLAALTVAAKYVKKHEYKLKGDLIVSAVADEVHLSTGARVFAESKWFKNSCGIVIAEPTGLRLVTAHRGALWLKIETFGKTAHTSMPHLGVNAIYHMTKIIEKLREYRFKYSPVKILPPPTLSVSVIQGGYRVNVVPDHCEIQVDIRTLPTQNHEEIINDIAKNIDELKKKDPTLKYKVSVIADRKPVHTDPNSPLVQKAIKVGKEVLNMDLKPEGAPFFSDAAEFIKHPGCPPVILFAAADTEQSHAINEHVEIDALERSVMFYMALAKEMLGEE